MGHKYSVPIVPLYPQMDPLFTLIGCTGLTRDDYDYPRLSSSPFLYYKFKASNYDTLMNQIIYIITNLPDPQTFGTPSANIPSSAPTSAPTSAPASAPTSTPSSFNLSFFGFNPSAATTKKVVIHNNFDSAGYSYMNIIPNDTNIQLINNKDDQKIYEISGYKDNREVYGPIYLFVAYDLSIQNNNNPNKIEGYLYFPSLTPERKPWSNYYYLSICHRWIYRLLYNSMYKLRPYDKCQIRLPGKIKPTYVNENNAAYKKQNETFINFDKIKKKKNNSAHTPASHHPSKPKPPPKPIYDPSSIQFGCRSDTGEICQESDVVHKAMGIYDSQKKSNAYPSVYFRTYQININDDRIKPFINVNSHLELVRNILPNNFEMFSGCKYMLISPNNKFYFMLGLTKFGIYYNIKNIPFDKLCSNNIIPKYAIPIKVYKFNGQYNNRLQFEDDSLNIYTQNNPSGSGEILVKSIKIIKTDNAIDKSSCTLLLKNTGALCVFDGKNNEVTDPTFGSIFSDINDNELSNISGSSPAINDEYSKNATQFDPDEEYRKRLENLLYYLRINNKLKETIILPPNNPILKPNVNYTKAMYNTPAAKGKGPSSYYINKDQQIIPEFDKDFNYFERYIELVKYLEKNKNIHINDILQYFPSVNNLKSKIDNSIANKGPSPASNIYDNIIDELDLTNIDINNLVNDEYTNDENDNNNSPSSAPGINGNETDDQIKARLDAEEDHKKYIEDLQDKRDQYSADVISGTVDPTAPIDKVKYGDFLSLYAPAPSTITVNPIYSKKNENTVPSSNYNLSKYLDGDVQKLMDEYNINLFSPSSGSGPSSILKPSAFDVNMNRRIRLNELRDRLINEGYNISQSDIDNY